MTALSCSYAGLAGFAFGAGFVLLLSGHLFGIAIGTVGCLAIACASACARRGA